MAEAHSGVLAVSAVADGLEIAVLRPQCHVNVEESANSKSV